MFQIGNTSVAGVPGEIKVLLKEHQKSKLEGIDVALTKDVTDPLSSFTAIITAMEGDKYPTLRGVFLRKKISAALRKKIS